MRYKELLNTNDILHLLTSKLNFIPKQIGKSIFFLCPFHDDKSPSLSFEPSRKIFTCFSCGFKAGDIFDFWAKYKNPSLINKEKLDESEIWKSLEEISKFGYFSLSILQEKRKQEQKNKNKIFYLNSLVTDIYQHNLFTQFGKVVLDYLYGQRQMDRLMIEKFSLGCTISGKQITNLLSQQKSENFSSLDLSATNLIWITNDNRVCDFFQEKQLVIPLTNPEGKIVSFATRKVGEVSSSEGKYKYLPSNQYFHKSSLLYNYSAVKKSRHEECYLVEGFFDVISLTKRGIENCVALLGTNLSEEQLKLLIELKKRIILFLDGDNAGKEAAINVSIKLLLHEVDCELIKYDYQGDPDEACHKIDKDFLISLLQRRENPYLFILEHYFTKWEVKENPQRVSRFISEIAKIFQKFKINIRNFLIEKITLLVKWNKEEVEPYFIQWNFPALNNRYYQVIYCREIIQKKERIIVCLCTQERFFWLFAMKQNHFFFNRSDRKKYQIIYNYYISSPYNNLFTTELNECYCKNSHKEKQFIPQQKKNLISKTFQEINSVKKFLLNYEKN